MMSSRTLALRAAGIVTGVAAVTAAAGCSTSTTSSPASATPAGSTASSAASTAASSAASTSAASSAAASSAAASGGASSSATASAASGGSGTGSGTPGCATRDLSVKAGQSEGAAGSLYQVLEFTNISNATCTLFGYPGVSLAAGTPVTQVGAAASRSTVSAATLVTLQPGQTASTLLRVTQAVNYPESKCKPTATTYLQIYPPNQTTPTYLAYSSTGCASTSVNLLTIGVMKSGTAG